MANKRNPEAAHRKRQRQYQRLQPQIDALYDELFRRFPQTFFRAPQDVHPLHIGIIHELYDRIDAPRQVLRRVMGRYTNRRAYLEALAEGKPRLDLSGQAVEPVSESHRAHATERLNRQRNWRRASRRSKSEPTTHAATSGATAPQAPAAATLSDLQAPEAFTPPPAVSAAATPPTNWSQSITTETIVCLECGQSFKQLSIRHLRMHGLDSGSYRTKYSIPHTQPLAARATTERRRQAVQETRPWEKATRYRQGQARNGTALAEPEAETLPEETKEASAATPAPPKRQRKNPPKKRTVG